ncbi:hypothetical protein ACHAXR_008529 [Thalassiosira sp. AJA248-18]
MDKERPPTLNAAFYRRKNLNMVEGAKPTGGGGPPPPPQIPPTATQHQQHAPPPPPRPPHQPPRPPSFAHRFATRAKNAVGRSLLLGGKVVGLVAAANIALYYYESNQVDNFFGTAASDDNDDNDSDDAESSKRLKHKKKRVLVLPFDNLKIIEQRKSGDFDNLTPLLFERNKQPTITLEAKELVDIIHKAASDPTISALYADFGEGMRYPMGYAHIEEIRNAIRIFNESHRVHRDPNINHNPVFAMMRNGNPKPSYAFGHSFQWNEYFLASEFSYVHLQARGNLNLFGVATTNTFLKGALDKYGVKAHVFRHGEYKNAPSILTDKKYSPAHLESVQSMTSSLNNSIRTCIENSRALNFDNVMWQSIFEYGSLTSANSAEIGLVDSIPPVDPLISLLDVNKIEAKLKLKKKSSTGSKKTDNANNRDDDGNEANKARKKMEEKFGLHESYSKFTATDTVSLVKYKQMLNKKAKIDGTRKQINAKLQKLSETSTATSMILSAVGLQPDKASSNREKIAVVTVDGNIASSLSYEIVRCLRCIRKDKDVKSVVLRVNSPGGSVTSSEAILEEIKLLDVPVICSMSNAAASGGYYISMNSEKIFAHPTTLTGSIGVFGGKIDATKWANSYGIRGDYYPRGSHAAAMHPLTPLTPGMKDNIARMVLDYYNYFKGVVATGRSLSVEEVEKVAQGRVWTGEQAKEVGLVDALGGLDRAISYARTAHTKADHVEIEHWPKNSFRFEDLPKMLSQESSYIDIVQALLTASLGLKDDAKSGSVEQLLSKLTELKLADKPHFLLTMDEETALDLIFRGE